MAREVNELAVMDRRACGSDACALRAGLRCATQPLHHGASQCDQCSRTLRQQAVDAVVPVMAQRSASAGCTVATLEMLASRLVERASDPAMSAVRAQPLQPSVRAVSARCQALCGADAAAAVPMRPRGRPASRARGESDLPRAWRAVLQRASARGVPNSRCCVLTRVCVQGGRCAFSRAASAKV